MSRTPERPCRMTSFPVEGTLGDALDAAFETRPDAVGWIFDDNAVTIAEMHRSVDAFARSLRLRGVTHGDRVAVMLPNRLEWAVALFGCARIGAVLVAMNTRWKSVEIRDVLVRSESKVLVVQKHFLAIDFEQRLTEAAALDGLPKLETVVEVDGPRFSGRTVSWESMLLPPTPDEEANLEQSPAPVVDSKDISILQFTSGSTAAPKGALLTQAMVLNYGGEELVRLGVQTGESYLSAQPLYHVAGSCISLPAPLLRDVRVVMPGHYDPGAVLRLIEREKCVSRGGTPTMYLDEISHPDFSSTDTSSLRSGWVGGAPTVLDQIRSEYAIEGLVSLYGATEGGGTFGSVDDPWEIRRATCGRPLNGTEFHVRDPDSRETLPAGSSGEIGFRGWRTAAGYIDATATSQAIDSHGFIHLGDLGHFDDEGYLHYEGRIKDMIRCGGENVAAEEVEAFLVQHPAIEQAAAIGRSDARLGEVVVAVVKTAPGAAELSEAEVIDFCAKSLANFRVPKAVHFVEDWPMTSSGKIHKPALRDRFGGGGEAPSLAEATA